MCQCAWCLERCRGDGEDTTSYVATVQGLFGGPSWACIGPIKAPSGKPSGAYLGAHLGPVCGVSRVCWGPVGGLLGLVLGLHGEPYALEPSRRMCVLPEVREFDG